MVHFCFECVVCKLATKQAQGSRRCVAISSVDLLLNYVANLTYEADTNMVLELGSSSSDIAVHTLLPLTRDAATAKHARLQLHQVSPNRSRQIGLA